MAITQKEIVGLKSKSSAYYVWDNDRTRGTGRLGVKVLASGHKNFVFRYFKEGRRLFIQLGRFPTLSLVDARARVQELGLMLKQGLDPKYELAKEVQNREEKRKEDESKGSVQFLFESYVSQMVKDEKRTASNVLQAL
ncbi:Arm DNA-binding domain-containing protein [Vibrio splendidus]|uniref:Arm DNA-binding domain-containing protein n=1 Tax=Vibrio splendidus TaxID=29497 RepID=UPI0021B30985|nr:Arm DNA-binding domain-containing protein [Vibrio splendidus]